MFDVGFWELSIIAVVALVVIGPERLPGVARTVGLWLGKIRGFVTSVKADIDREIQADELKKILDRQSQSSGIHDILEETEQAVNKLQKDYLVHSVDDNEELKREMEISSSGNGLEAEPPAHIADANQPAAEAHSADSPASPEDKDDHGRTKQQ